MRTALIISTVSLALLAGTASADYIILGTHTDYPVQAGRSLADVRMSVDLSVSNGLATVTFTNVSAASETAVFEEIVVDGYDDDTGTAILWNAEVLTDTHDVRYSLSGHPNGLPGYQTETADALIELQAKSSPVKYGIAPGEALQVRFNTSLADGSTLQSYLDAFGGGDDTGHYTIGFHAINAAVVNGESLSGVALPEPGSAMLFLFGTAAILRRRAVVGRIRR